MVEAAKAEAGDVSGTELESMQAAAKWLVAAGAAVMAVLVAGLQLSALARLTFDTPLLRVLAPCVLVIGLLAVGCVLVLAARVLVQPGWTMNKIAHLDSPPMQEWNTHWLREELAGQRRLLVPGGDLRPRKFYDHGHDLLSAWYDLYEKGSASLTDDVPGYTYRLAVPGDVERLNQRLSNIQEINRRVVEAANLADARRRYNRLTKSLPWMGLVLTMSVGALAYLAATSSDVQLTAPVGVTAQFVSDRAVLIEAGVPEDCAGLTVAGVAVGGSLRQPVIVSNNKDCTLNQVSVSADVALVLPKVPNK